MSLLGIDAEVLNQSAKENNIENFSCPLMGTEEWKSGMLCPEGESSDEMDVKIEGFLSVPSVHPTSAYQQAGAR